MATNLNIDEQLLQEALRLGHKQTKRETINEALSEYIQRRAQKKTIKLFGTIDFDLKYKYKKLRQGR